MAKTIQPRTRTTLERIPHGLAVPALLLVVAGLAVTSLLSDSITFDETAHLTAGFSYLKTGDFRLQPEHPPLPKVLAGLPLLGMDHRWPPAETPGWREGDFWRFGWIWLNELADGRRLLVAARCALVPLLLATCLTIYGVSRRLFGRDAGLLALTLAALSPTLLAHGRLVGNDVTAALVITLNMLTLARLLERITWVRFGLAVLAAAGLPLVKFSWLLALPPMLLMVLVAIARRTPPAVGSNRRAESESQQQSDREQGLATRPRRAVILGALVIVLALAGWGGVWSAYGWRYSAFRGVDQDKAMFIGTPDPGQPTPTTLAQAWETILRDAEGQPMRGILPGFVRFARERHLLPEAYVYGLAHTLKFTASQRPAYLNGEIYTGGRAAYFPVAFALKTPIPTMLLMLMGIGAIGLRRTPLGRDPILLTGLAAFAVLFATVSMLGDFNLGQRHLLPVYPPLMAFAGAAVAWLGRPPARVVVGVSMAWILAANLFIHPNYLCYFNELAGGPGGGYRRLIDSNADWGQNLERLARYARQHPDETIRLAYFGSADPRRYGFACTPLPSFLPFDEPAPLTGGTYVISVNQLQGLYDPVARDATWEDEGARRRYRYLYDQFGDRASASEPGLSAADVGGRRARFEQLQWSRLLHQLRRREPDERIGYSLFVYRLSNEEIDELTKP